MFSTGLTEGLIFPVTENGETKSFVTNAPFELITPAFQYAENMKEFIDYIKEEGYAINEYRSSIRLNFDNK